MKVVGFVERKEGIQGIRSIGFVKEGGMARYRPEENSEALEREKIHA